MVIHGVRTDLGFRVKYGTVPIRYGTVPYVTRYRTGTVRYGTGTVVFWASGCGTGTVPLYRTILYGPYGTDVPYFTVRCRRTVYDLWMYHTVPYCTVTVLRVILPIHCTVTVRVSMYGTYSTVP